MTYTIGFISILAFTSVIGSSAYVILSITDAFFKRRNWKFFMKGWGSVLLWFCIFVLWLCVIAAFTGIYLDVENGPKSFGDKFWFAFISVTTVGFGDYYFHHDRFHQVDMLYIPLLMLLGFVFLANFLGKLAIKIVNLSVKYGLADDEDLEMLLEMSVPSDKKN